jgi:hypothetical protein
MKFLLITFVIVSIVSLSLFLFVVYNLPPGEVGHLLLINVSLFLLSGFVFLASALSLVLYSLSFVFEGKKKDSGIYKERNRSLFKKALRRGSEVASIFLFLTGIKLLGIFNPLNALLIILVVGLLEVYFTSNHK